MRCLVTGASGHLGSHLVRQLLHHGHEVTGMIRPTSDTWRLTDVLGKVKFIRADLADMGTAASFIVAAKSQVVFHLAWAGVSREFRDDPLQFQVNLAGTNSFLSLMEQVKPECFVGLGSQAETQASQYGLAKLQAAQRTQEICARVGIRSVWLRLYATYGPADDVRHLIPSVILQLLAGQSPALSSGTQKWDYLYVEDAARAICQIGCATTAHGVFNLASGASRPVREIVTLIRDLVDPGLPLRFGAIAGVPADLEADISRLQAAMDWRPRIALVEGLRRTVAWYREHR